MTPEIPPPGMGEPQPGWGMRHLLAALAAMASALAIGLLAMGAHLEGGARLTQAGNMLLMHAPFLFLLPLSGVFARLSPLLGIGGLGFLWVGLLLFCGDLCARTLLGGPLFAMAAPIGGVLLMTGWLTLSLAALIGPKPKRA